MTINIYALQFSSDMIPTSRILDRIICRVVGVDDDWNACLNDNIILCIMTISTVILKLKVPYRWAVSAASDVDNQAAK